MRVKVRAAGYCGGRLCPNRIFPFHYWPFKNKAVSL
nr:MAG TPA: Golgi reassembly-stacking protein 1, Golgin fold six-stranded anti parallel-barrel.96A [Caudoviricetes sp.]